MCWHPSTPIAPPMTVPSVQKPMVRNAVDGAGGGQDARLVPLVQQLDAAVVEEGSQAQQRVTRVERLADRLWGHDRHPNLLVCLD